MRGSSFTSACSMSGLVTLSGWAEELGVVTEDTPPAGVRQHLWLSVTAVMISERRGAG